MAIQYILIYHIRGGFGANPKHWYSKPSSGGLLWELGYHPAYILAWFLGRIDDVSACGIYHFHSYHSNVQITVKNDKNMTGTIHFSPSSIQTYFLEVIGTKGALYLDLITDAVLSKNSCTYKYSSPSLKFGFEYAKDQLRKTIVFNAAIFRKGPRSLLLGKKALNQYALFKTFVEYVNNKGPFHSTPEIGLYALKILEGTFLSLGIELPKPN